MMHSWKREKNNIVEAPINVKINEEKNKIIEVKNSVNIRSACES